MLILAPSGSHDTGLPKTSPFPAPPRVVGLAGAAGCGKSTVAAYLQAKHGYIRVRFADPLKKAMAAIGCTEAEIEGHLKQVPSKLLCGKTPRFAMQTIGTEWGRNTIGEDLWVNAWLRAVDNLSGRLGVGIVADDVRFPNEATAIWQLGGFIFEIERPGQTKISTSNHPSETESAKFKRDGKIINDGNIDDLHRAAYYNIIRGEAVPKAKAA